MLSSRDVQATGLGNANDLVGRFFMEHIWFASGRILSTGTEPLLRFYGAEHSFGNVKVRGHIALPDEVSRELRTPLFRAELSVRGPSIKNTDAAISAGYLRRRLIGLDWPEELGNHLINVLSGFDDLFDQFIGSERKFPAMYSIFNYVEQVPNQNSRITLTSERDALGLNRPAVNWQLSELDKIGIQKAQRVIAQEVGRSGFGRMRLEMPENEDIILEGADGGAHHMGTTRMHVNPRRGVVDETCRVHGIDNIYIAGSSVFPTAGYVNPTLTIVALAIRLADHLKAKIGT
jgi:hypothetical protein